MLWTNCFRGTGFAYHMCWSKRCANGLRCFRKLFMVAWHRVEFDFRCCGYSKPNIDHDLHRDRFEYGLFHTRHNYGNRNGNSGTHCSGDVTDKRHDMLWLTYSTECVIDHISNRNILAIQ